MPAMPAEMEERLERASLLGQRCLVGISELVQRVAIIAADVVLIVLAGVALQQDRGHECDENLRTYGCMCGLLCFLDLSWEFVRCSLDSSLDRLQQDFKSEGASPNLAGGCGNEGLLGGATFNEGPVGSPTEQQAGNSTRAASISSAASPIGLGVRREKASRSKRTKDLHFWSLVFTASVSIVFSFFSMHDEDCAERVPSLYFYIHTFTYVFIFRLGAIILWGCCRTVKDYEDAANAAGRLPAKRLPVALQLRTF